MGQTEPMKIFRLNLKMLGSRSEMMPAMILRGGKRPQAKLSVDPKNFVSVNSYGITLSPGRGNHINIQGMSQNMRYGGMVTDLDFPLSLLPVTPFTPFPNQRFAPPLRRILPAIIQIAAVAALFPA